MIANGQKNRNGAREKADERGKQPHKEFRMILHSEGSLMPDGPGLSAALLIFGFQ